MDILVADDDPVFRLALEDLITGWGYGVRAVGDGRTAWHELTTNPPALAVLDWVMPGLDGLDLCRKLRERPGAGPTYVILVSARADTADVVAGLEAGADDYVSKPVDFLELRARLRVGLRMVELQGRLSARVDELNASLAHVRRLQQEAEAARLREQHLALHDGLTGLPNRQLFFDRLHQAVAQAKRDGRQAAVLFVDLDGFKQVNDGLGHEAGDQVLKAVSRRLQACVRECDTVARLGGDEFAIALGGFEHASEAAGVADKLVDCLADAFPVGGHTCLVGASIGVSLYPSDGHDPESLVKRADFAMYRAKRQGKNRFVLYDPSLDARVHDRVTLEHDLRGALGRGEFTLHYQPQVSCAGGDLTGVEALLRWRQHGATAVPPARFLPLAEETGLIVSIGEWALHTACTHHRSAEGLRGPHLRTAVNLSARQFHGKHLPELVARVLAETGLEPSCLDLEITESTAMQCLDHSVATLRRLKDLGVSLSVDDFGTGHSSLTYLKRFPVDRLKIDRSFVRGLPDDRDDVAITTAIIALAHTLGMRVTAEGVETPAQWQFLQAQGCDEAQGYFVSPPLSAERLCGAALAGT